MTDTFDHCPCFHYKEPMLSENDLWSDYNVYIVSTKYILLIINVGLFVGHDRTQMYSMYFIVFSSLVVDK